MGKDEKQVLFKHEKHVSSNCRDCHSKLFQIKKGSNNIDLLTHESQKYCFGCHDGKKEFSWNSCKKCHKDWKEIDPYCLLTPKADRGSCVKCHTNADEMKALVKPPKIGGEAEG
jgi:c(7)-type cytochrome triheme protein